MSEPALPPRRTRLVATIGPASVGIVEELVGVGLDVARINLSHGTQAEHAASAAEVRKAAARAGRSVGILIDLPGPKLRLGELEGAEAELVPGTTVSLGDDGRDSDAVLPFTDVTVLQRLRPGDRVLLADGAAELRVLGAGKDGVEAEVVRGGQVRSRAGVSVPAERLASGVLAGADEAMIPHLLGLEPDFVGQSFVRSAADVAELRSLLPAGVRLVAKIETRAAVEAIEEILVVADAIMVARGDLGVELPFERVPLVQKELVRAALRAGRPSIVATQMLESMIEAPRPTRAEASDVANAILDGADAVMLSGETAIGNWPVAALRAAASISEATDAHHVAPARPQGISADFEADPDARATAMAAATMADEDEDVVALACYTRTGRTARLLSALRPRVPIVAFTGEQACARSLSLRRGVIPVVLEVAQDQAAIARAVSDALSEGVAELTLPEERAVVLVTSSSGGPNTLEILRPGR